MNKLLQLGFGSRISNGGCIDTSQYGYYFLLAATGKWSFYAGVQLLQSGEINQVANTWNTMSLLTEGNTLTGEINGNILFKILDNTFQVGWAGIATGYNLADFDNFSLVNLNANSFEGIILIVHG